MLLMSLCLALALSAAQPHDAQAFDWLGQIELAAEGLQSEDAQLRLKAVSELQGYAIEWTRDYLLTALGDSDVNVRAAAGRILAKHRVRRAIPIITAWLSEADIQSKQVAADILGELGNAKAAPALVRSLGDPDPSVRVHAILALGKIGGDSVIVPLVTRLEDTKGEVRGAAVQVLRELGDARAVIPLVGLFNDPSLDVRTAAMEAVGVLGEESAAAALLRELRENRDRAERVKIAAVTALGNLEAESALPDLLIELETGSSDLRAKVAYSLAQIASAHEANPQSQQALTRLVESLGDNRMRNAAREALLRAGPTGVPVLIDYLEGKLAKGDPLVAVELLQKLDDKRATPVLITELERARVPQRVVMQALRSLGDARALLPLLALLEDSEPAVRKRAMLAIRPLLTPESEAADLIAERLEDPDLEIRVLAADYLGAMRARSAAAPLAALVRNGKEPTLRAHALAALGQIGDRSATPLALQVLQEGPAELRPLAADVLTELSDPGALAPLMKLAKDQRSSYRHLAITSLGAVVRDTNSEGASALLQDIALSGRRSDAVGALEALSGMKASKSAARTVAKLSQSLDPELRLAALVALGSMGASSSREVLRRVVQSGTDADAAAAAWSLGQLGDRESIPALLTATRRSGLAAPVNASAALVKLARPEDRKAVRLLLLHRLPLVRVNAMLTLATLGDKSAGQKLVKSLRQDPSYLVRIAALRALSMLGLGADVIAERAEKDAHADVRQAAKARIKQPFQPKARDNWMVFRVVDSKADDKPVPRELRFFVGSDGVATVAHSDALGRIVYQDFPPGPFVEGAVSDLSRF